MPARLFDAHNHLHDAWLTPHRDQVFNDMAEVGISGGVVNGTSEADWEDVAALCGTRTIDSRITLIPAFGLHPWEVGNRSADWQTRLISHLDAHPTAGIGEIGLDRWILDRARPDDARLRGLRRAPLPEQIEVFRTQLELAAARDAPASVHCLDAFGFLYDVLRDSPRLGRGFLLHAYSGPTEMIPAFAKLGAFFSFNASFLEARKQRLRDVYATVPIDRLLIETDAPAMRPPASHQPFSLPAVDGEHPINHPANLAAAYAGLAELRATALQDLAAQVEENFFRLFGEGGGANSGRD